MSEADTEFAALVAQHDEAITALIARLLPSSRGGEVDEVRQRAWIRLWQRRSGFAARAQFSTWAWRVVVNLCRDWRREHARRLELHEYGLDAPLEPSTEPRPEEEAARAEERSSVRAALDALPDDERECLVLRHYHALDVTEIAEIIGRPRTTVQDALARGLHRLRFRLRRTFEESHELRRDDPPAAAARV